MELTDIIASLAGLAAAVLFLRVWQPSGREEALAVMHADRERELALVGGEGNIAVSGPASDFNVSADELEERARGLTKGRMLFALFPYLLPPVKEALTGTDIKIPWPGLDGEILTASGEVSGATTYTLAWLSSPGSMLLVCGLIVAFVYGIGISGWAGEVAAIAHKMRFAFLTVASMLALAYVMNLSGQTITIGTWIAGTGAAFAFLSPTLGWIGTAVTGSDTSANALFATLQQSAAQTAGIDPTLLVAANTSGGVVGKMISPQNLTIAATAVGLIGRESDILRKVLPWSIGLIIAMCILVGLQSTVLAWMLP